MAALVDTLLTEPNTRPCLQVLCLLSLVSLTAEAKAALLRLVRLTDPDPLAVCNGKRPV